jgi:CheY-like chemotaxis protein
MNTIFVLFIDDDEFQREFVGDMLRDLGVVEVLTATGGESGLALYDSLARKPDLLLCDLSMPDMDGIEFLRHIAERGYEGSIGVLSGVGASLLKAADTLARSYGLNLLGVIKKPARREEIHAILNHVGDLRPSQPAHTAEPPLSADELRAGLASDQVEVFFQPKVSTSGRCMVGVECLARWRHPERGLLGPHTFIAVAEQHGLIDELTLAILRRATTHLSEWLDQGHGFNRVLKFAAPPAT